MEENIKTAEIDDATIKTKPPDNTDSETTKTKPPDNTDSETTKAKPSDNTDSEVGEKKYPLLTSQPMMWKDLISPEVHALAIKAIRFHMSLVASGPQKDGEKVGKLIFLFEDCNDAETAKTIISRIASSNGAELDRPVKVNLDMVKHNSNEITNMEKIDRRNVYIRNFPKNTTAQLLKFLFPKAITVHIPTDEDGNPARYAIMRCKTNQEARICVENGNGMLINDTEIILERIQRKKSKFNKKKKQSVNIEKSNTNQHDKERTNYRKNAYDYGRGNFGSGRKMEREFYSGGFGYVGGYY